jgi:hypothetical protein
MTQTTASIASDLARPPAGYRRPDRTTTRSGTGEPAASAREVYRLPATDERLASVEQALRRSELERKRLLDAHATERKPQADEVGDQKL